MANGRSADLFARSEALIPGGVNSPVRAFKAVGGTPFFVKGAKGCHLFDVDGNRLIDYVGSWGPAIVGHAHEKVLEAVEEAARQGLGFGAPTPAELEFAEAIAGAIESVEMVRAVSSGTESAMTAIRIARGHTGRDAIVKFDGCYHGHSDSLLVKAGSGAATLGRPSSGGVTEGAARDTVVLPFNDADAVRDTFARSGDSVAAVIVEPVPGNMNLVLPAGGFLETLRECCDRHGSVLIFDEVMSGFRVSRGGAQARLGVRPDLTCLGKVIGGGMPVAAVGGRRDIMSNLAPLGPVYQAGTLSGNPVALAAGLATIRLVMEDGFLEKIEDFSRRLCEGLEREARDAGVPLRAQSIGAMLGWYCSGRVPSDMEEAKAHSAENFRRFFHGMLARGVYVAPSAFEAGFAGIAHTEEGVLEETLAAARDTLREIAAQPRDRPIR